MTVVNVVVTFLGGNVEVGGGVRADRKEAPTEMVRMQAIMMSQHNHFLVREFTA